MIQAALEWIPLLCSYVIVDKILDILHSIINTPPRCQYNIELFFSIGPYCFNLT